MVQVYHVVGWVGSGKSTLIKTLAAGFQAEHGWQCAGVDPEIQYDRTEALAKHPEAQVVFIEHENPHLWREETAVDPADKVIVVERAGRASFAVPAPGVDGQPDQPQAAGVDLLEVSHAG